MIQVDGCKLHYKSEIYNCMQPKISLIKFPLLVLLLVLLLLLFNMAFNTFIQHIKSEKYSQFGFWKINMNSVQLNPIHWFQFADDAAVISRHERANQILLNRFTV